MGISIWQLLIVFAIVLVLFGARRLRNIGGDLGDAVKGFRQAMNEEEEAERHSDNLVDSAVNAGKQDRD